MVALSLETLLLGDPARCNAGQRRGVPECSLQPFEPVTVVFEAVLLRFGVQVLRHRPVAGGRLHFERSHAVVSPALLGFIPRLGLSRLS
jgi:hypothetical protein